MAQTARFRRPFIARVVGIVVAVVVAFGIFLYFVGWPHLRVTRAPAVPAPTIPGKGTPMGRLEQAGVPNNNALVNLDPRAVQARRRAGSNILLMDASVEQLAGPDAFWIGPVFPTGAKINAKDESPYWMLVVENSTAAAPVQPGMQVRVAGVLEMMPSNVEQLFKLNGNSEERAAKDKIYLLADNVGPASKSTR